MKKETTPKAKMDMITACESIVKLTKDSQLSKSMLKKADPYMEYLSNEQTISKMQALWLALILELGIENSVYIEDIVNHLDCQNVTLLRYQKDLDQLTERHFLTCDTTNKGYRFYNVPKSVAEALVANKRFIYDAKDFVENPFEISLPAEAEEDMDDDDLPQRRGSGYILIDHTLLQEKELFYNTELALGIDRLALLLSQEKFADVRQRFIDKKMQPAFNCIFYGAPGTGKTETVKQLARKTGRDIMMVDLSQMRNRYVGESEKSVKGVFDDYRQMVKDMKDTPILLFNEADGIFSHRTEQIRHSTDKLDNTLQNIILQEMEELDGILIATTNLIGNLDRAFERRFLFKMNFTKPDANTRRHIWHAMMPELNSQAVEALAARHEFSGGQIQNVVKRVTIDTVLSGIQTPTLPSLDSYCHQERIQSDRQPIGF